MITVLRWLGMAAMEEVGEKAAYVGGSPVALPSGWAASDMEVVQGVSVR